MLRSDLLATGIGSLIPGIFAIVFHKKINESIIKFYRIKDTRPKPYAEKRFIFMELALIIIGFGKRLTS